MNIIRLQGTDKKLYELIAPLVLNPAVLRQNNNYPFKTGPKYIWHIAIEKEQILGFIPVKQIHASSCMIDNYYIKGDNLAVLNALLDEILANINNKIELWATVHKRHVQSYKLKDFRTHIEWKNYERMLYYSRNNETICID
ncbi:MAG: hypothetical protein LUH63_18470 [Parabacteroides sp.]|nr:hypothetical protein [Parabacteroides sp.]